MGWVFEPEDERPREGALRPELERAMELDERGYECTDCAGPIPEPPYTRIPGELLSYAESSDLHLTVEYLCRSCWRIHVLGAGLQW